MAKFIFRLLQVSPLNGTALSTKFVVMIGEGWIDPEGDIVVFYIHTEKIGQEKICRMNARPISDKMLYDLMLGKGKVNANDTSDICYFVEKSRCIM